MAKHGARATVDAALLNGVLLGVGRPGVTCAHKFISEQGAFADMVFVWADGRAKPVAEWTAADRQCALLVWSTQHHTTTEIPGTAKRGLLGLHAMNVHQLLTDNFAVVQLFDFELAKCGWSVRARSPGVVAGANDEQRLALVRARIEVAIEAGADHKSDAKGDANDA